VKKETIKILGICGAQRKGQNTHYALSRCMAGISALGIPVETEMISLPDLRIEDCRGCHLCFMQSGKSVFCPVIDDDMNKVYPKLLEADGIIVASPVHWWSATAKLRRFIDRTNPFCGASNGEYGGALYNKVGGVITVAYDVHGGTEVAATHILTWMLTVNLIVVGTQGAHVGGTAATNLGVPPAASDSVKFDHHGMKTVYEVGKRVAETAYLLKYGRVNITEEESRKPDLKNPPKADIDWDKYYQYENSFPKEHIGVEQRLATSAAAFEKFIALMKDRKKLTGNTWAKMTSEEEFRSAWLGRRKLELLTDDEIHDLCPEYYDFFSRK